MKKNKKRKSGIKRDAFAGTILSIFADNPFKSYNYKQICHKLGIHDIASRDRVYQLLNDLKDSGDLQEASKGKYILNAERLPELAKASNTIYGSVDMKSTGKAYIINDQGGDDIFISASNTNHALHGDMVKVHLFPKRRGHKPEGKIIEVVERKKTSIVGRLEKLNNYAFVIPDSQNIPVDVFIPAEKLGKAKNGEKVIAKIIDWPAHANNPFGEIETILGKPGTNEVEMLSILAGWDFPLQFPEEVEKQADLIPDKISASELKHRKDFRKVTTFTIDPEDAKDFDDALSFQKLENGNVEVGVHIADVAHYVRPGTAIDKEAYERATSVYLVDRVIPMLPEKLSNKVCSLRPKEDKLCYSAVFEMDKNAVVLKEWFGKTVIHSNHRFTYEEAQKVLDEGQGPFADELIALNQLARKLRNIRFQNGSINFHSQEVKFVLDENGHPVDTFVKEMKESNELIEDFMLLANRKVAEFIGKTGEKKERTFVYRVHDEPNPEKLHTFVQFLRKLGYGLNISSRKKLVESYNHLFEQVKGKGEEHLVETIAVRTMAKASYSTDNIGHYGLAFPYYTHFTSPIRRYPDLMVHRLLSQYMNGGKSVDAEVFEDYCKHCSEAERRAMEAERESVKLKQAEFLMDKIGQRFSGLISGVSKWGIFVELHQCKCEGLVRMESLRDDFYYLDEDNYQIIGKRYGQEYRLGDQVKVLVVNVNLSKKQMDFQLVDEW